MADRHIANLEGKLLKLKEARRELKKLKQEKQALEPAAIAVDLSRDIPMHGNAIRRRTP